MLFIKRLAKKDLNFVSDCFFGIKYHQYIGAEIPADEEEKGALL